MTGVEKANLVALPAIPLRALREEEPMPRNYRLSRLPSSLSDEARHQLIAANPAFDAAARWGELDRALKIEQRTRDSSADEKDCRASLQTVGRRGIQPPRDQHLVVWVSFLPLFLSCLVFCATTDRRSTRLLGVTIRQRYRDLLALAFESRLRIEDAFGKVLRGVGLGCGEARLSGRVERCCTLAAEPCPRGILGLAPETRHTGASKRLDRRRLERWGELSLVLLGGQGQRGVGVGSRQD